MQEMTLAVNAATTPVIQLWMNWMLLVFAASLIFVWKNVPARVVLLAFVASAICGYLIYKTTGNVWLLGIPHLVFWGPLALYLWKSFFSKPSFNLKSAYGIWIALLLVTIVVSLVFDVRDLALVFLQKK